MEPIEWAKLFNSKEFWGAVGAGIPIIAALANSFYKIVKGDGGGRTSKINCINDLLKNNSGYLSYEDKVFMANKINTLVMRPYAKFNNPEFRRKYIYIENRTRGELKPVPWRSLIQFIEVSEASNNFQLNYETGSFKKARIFFKFVGVFYILFPIYQLARAKFDTEYLSPLGSFGIPILIFFSIFYAVFAIFMFTRIPFAKRCKEINLELNKIDATNFISPPVQ